MGSHPWTGFGAPATSRIGAPKGTGVATTEAAIRMSAAMMNLDLIKHPIMVRLQSLSDFCDMNKTIVKEPAQKTFAT